METKALKKQMGAAIAMVLVAAVALAASTFAWFVSNNTVKATTSAISAQSNAPFLKIAKADTDATDQTELNNTSISYADDAHTALYPAEVFQTTTGQVFKSAYAAAADSPTAIAGSLYEVGEPDVAATNKFALKKIFKIGTTDANAGSFTKLKVSKVEVVTGKDDAKGLKDAISVLLVCGDKWAVYKASNDGQVLISYKDSATVALPGNTLDGILADKIEAANSVEVKAYVFYDGSEQNVYSDNYTNLKDCSINIEFTATPMNTQGTDANGAANAATRA